GDGNGDLKGLQSKLDYIKKLGATSILLSPIQSSIYYHNYFADDFEIIDPEFGTKQDFLDLVRDAHRHGLRLYMDMETQYVTDQHPWWKEGVDHPDSKYRNFLLYEDAAHHHPASIMYGEHAFTGYDGVSRQLATVNLRSPEVLDYNVKLFSDFVDPNHDGRFDDGVDGFRLDHAMDTLDGKKELGDLFARFWKPLVTRVKKVNPAITFIAEQANWLDYGTAYYTKAGVDHVFAFGIRFAMITMDKTEISKHIHETLAQTPPGKQQIVFLENHDVSRFASNMGGHKDAIKAGAAVEMLIGQVPSIYYGQELGMTGINRHFNDTDANDIPVREAFEWNASDSGPGMALWYKGTGI
ncbi:MAG TPA: alpha-amylase family glycosyl hydrolase, partial [Saprospiraceae bacterium]|nr:alpha-amylase family glycosyl hydrolase [Saprospiraceae bacterium]